MKRTDALRVMRHFVDVAALRSDPVLQRQTLVDGLSEILGTNNGWLFALDDFRPDRTPRYRTQLLTSNPNADWLKYITEYGVRTPITDDPYASAVLFDNRRRQVWTQKTALPDAAALAKFSEVVAAMRALQVSDGIIGVARIGPDRHNIVGFSLHTMRENKLLGQRAVEIARLAVAEIERLVETGALHFGPPALSDLSPRLQQTLVRLMEGKSAKDIATDLAISVPTVREHLQRLYSRYDVSSREELMAKFIRPE